MEVNIESKILHRDHTNNKKLGYKRTHNINFDIKIMSFT